MSNFPVVDAHFHIWDLTRLHIPWLTDDIDMTHVIGDYSPICRTYTLDEYMANATPYGVVKAVHVQAAVGHPNPVDETAWVQEVADAAGFPVGIVGYADLRQQSMERVLDAHMRYPGFRGVRMLWEPGLLEDAAFMYGLSAVQERGLVYDLDTDPPFMKSACTLVARFPTLQFVLGHFGFPKRTDPEYFRQWKIEITELAKAPNVACKLSGLSMTYHSPSPEIFRPWIEHSWDVFGVDRCLFGSNWPVDGLFSDFPTVMRCYLEPLEPMTSANRTAFLSANAERIYRL